MRVYLFGDSIARGVQYDEEKGRYRRRPGGFAEIAQKQTGVPVENFGRFGSTIGKGIRVLDRNIASMPAGSVVLTEFGGNDCDYDWDQVAADPTAEHLPNTPPRLFPVLYESMIRELLDAGMKPAVMTLPPLDPERFFRWISRGRDADAILAFLGGDKDRLYRWHQSYSACVRRAAETFGLPVLDVRRAFLDAPDYRALQGVDGIHPNAEGHRVIAGVVSKFLAGLNLAGETVRGVQDIVDEALRKAS